MKTSVSSCGHKKQKPQLRHEAFGLNPTGAVEIERAALLGIPEGSPLATLHEISLLGCIRLLALLMRS